MKDQIPQKEERLIRLKEVLAIIPVQKSCWWNWVKTQKAPAPIRLGRCTCWRYSEIIAMTRVEKSNKNA
jgi:predicted DNA-binding transcriptional regulator AlpA